MNKEVDVAVVGATGAVGEAMIDILEQRQFPDTPSVSFGVFAFGRQDGALQR